MEPTFSSGEHLLVRRFQANRFKGSKGVKNQKSKLKIGDIVLVEREVQPGIEYIKRIHEIDGSPREYFLLSDNPAGTDSRKWGLVREDEIVGYIVAKK